MGSTQNAVASSPIPYDASVSQMEMRLQSLSTIGDVAVERSSTTNGNFAWTITFLTDPGNLPELSLSDSKMLSGNGATVSFQTVTNGSSPLGGEFTISFDYGGILAETAAIRTCKFLRNGKCAEALQNVGDVSFSRHRHRGGWAHGSFVSTEEINLIIPWFVEDYG